MAEDHIKSSSTMPIEVAIFGGGIGGLSAAHELLERGYCVKIYERQHIPGGKARSFGYESTPPGAAPDIKHRVLSVPCLNQQRVLVKSRDAVDPPPALPAEHGFRFFPGFYRHIVDTMRRTPRLDGRGNVADDLVGTREVGIARNDGHVIKMPTDFARRPWRIRRLIQEVERSDTGLTYDDWKLFTSRVWQIMTSCEARRIAEYERIGWWKFIERNEMQISAQFRRYFGNLTRSLVAAQPNLASTRTNGDILVQLIIDFFNPGCHPDRLLNGPTNEVWIHPWIQHLKSTYRDNFEYYLDVAVVGFDCNVKQNRITGARIEPSTSGVSPTRIVKCDRHRVYLEKADLTGSVTAHHYISAIPVERMAPLVTQQMIKCDPNLRWIKYLKKSVEWMNGIVFYLKEDVPIAHGHVLYLDPPYSLTSVSQAQFWINYPLSGYATGEVKATISVDISNWAELLDEELEDIPIEIWNQLKMGLNVDGEVFLEDSNLLYFSLDPAIQEVHSDRKKRKAAGQNAKQEAINHISELANSEPLLVNTIDSWRLRPYPDSRITNFFLAADYVRTNTDLATMEAANEAARRVVNAILDYDGSRSKRIRVWSLRQIWFLAPFRWRDRWRFDRGSAWKDPLPWLPNIVPPIWRAACWVLGVVRHNKAAPSKPNVEPS